MEKFDRSKIKGANRDSAKEQRERAQSHRVVVDDDRPQYHKISDGKNIFRICPPHNPDNPAFEAKMSSFLPAVVEDNGKDVVKPRPVLNAKLHGGMSRDIVEEYIKHLQTKLSDEITDKDELRRVLAPITGAKIKGKWQSGIVPKLSYVAYAFKGEVLGRLEVSESQMARIDELSEDEESDEPIQVDLLSDPDNGYSLIITYDKDAQDSKNKYSIKRGLQVKPIPEDKLKQWWSKEPLVELFRQSYTKDDYERAVAGLQIIDEENEFNLWDDQEWLDVVAELDKEAKKLKPRALKKADSESKKSDSRSGSRGEERRNTSRRGEAVEEAEDAEEVGIRDMSREELIQYISDHELPVPVKARHTADQLRTLIEDAEADKAEAEFNKKVSGDSKEEAEDDGKAESPFSGVANKYRRR